MESLPKETAPEASPLTDAEKIRLKRLAKLQQNASSSTGTGIPKVVTQESSTPKASPKKIQQQIVQEPTEKKSATVSPKPQQPVKSFGDWQNEVISRVLRITLDKSSAQKSSNQLIYLDSVVQELIDVNPGMSSFKLTKSILDNALVARLSMDPNRMSDDVLLPQILPFDYLLECWQRAVEIKRNLIARNSKTFEQSIFNDRVDVIDTLKGLISNYAELVIHYPEMFPQPKSTYSLGPLQLVPKILADIDTPEGLPWEFIQELVGRVDEDGFEEVFGPSLTGISAQMRVKKILSGDYSRPLNTLLTLTEIKSFSSMLPNLRVWNPPELAPRAFELASFLGPFCRISAFPMDEPTIVESYFANVQQSRQADVDSAMISLRGAIQGVQKSMFNIFNNIIRSSPSAREGVLDYLATAVKLNEKRAQIQVDPLQVGTDGFLMNLTKVLLTLADPFMDVHCSKIDRIDADYFRKSKRIDVSYETKIKATQQEYDEYCALPSRNGDAPNFISEIFFLTIAMHHYGPLHCYEKYNNLIKDLSELQRQYDRMRLDQPNWAGTPSGALNEEILKRCKLQLEKGASHKIAYDAQLLDNAALSHSLQFYNLVINWILRIVDPVGKHPAQQIRLPLPKTPPEAFIMLPEYIIEDITEFFLFISRYIPKVSLMSSRDELVIFIITFLNSSSYIKNPYLKAKLVEILFHYTLHGENEGGIGAILVTHPLSLNHLMPSLMLFYVEVEQTGAHTQFYDKFNIRYNISQIFKAIWNNNTHRERLKEESRETESFVRFINLLMNDATYLLDESLTKLTEIHNIQAEMDNRMQWDSQTPQHRQEREALLRSLERQATSYMALGNETVHMLEYMTSEVVDPFLTPQIVDRLAAMLDYNLVSLVGPKCTELRVKNREKYRFQPRELLSQLVSIYLNLCKHKEFVQAVARDGRSYHKGHFSKAAAILVNRGLKSEKDVEELERFVNEVEEVIKAEAAGEEELGEIPEEFLDPLMYSIMEDPVILPESKVTIDRSTITTHLLSDATDPFNRKPLSIDQVIPNTQLKEKIAAYRRKKQNRKS